MIAHMAAGVLSANCDFTWGEVIVTLARDYGGTMRSVCRQSHGGNGQKAGTLGYAVRPQILI